MYQVFYEQDSRERANEHTCHALRTPYVVSPGSGAPDPSAGALNDKQRQIVKDKFSAVNAAVDEARKSQPGWTVPDDELRERLRARLNDEVVAAYRGFYERYVDSGFTRKNPHKYIVYTPAAMEEVVRSFFSSS